MRKFQTEYIPVRAFNEEGFDFRPVVQENGPEVKAVQVEIGIQETATPAALGDIHNIPGIADTLHPTHDDIEYLKTLSIEERPYKNK